MIILITNNFEEYYTKAFGTPSKFIDTIAQKNPHYIEIQRGVVIGLKVFKRIKIWIVSIASLAID